MRLASRDPTSTTHSSTPSDVMFVNEISAPSGDHRA
jgi:hypothetical protein